MKKINIFLFILIQFFISFGFADTISENLIFSNDTPEGAAICSEIEASGYCEKEVPIYNKEGFALKSKEKLQGACVKGGGDCLMAVFILKTKSTSSDKILALVKSEKQSEVWIQIPKIELKKIEELIPELGTGANSVSFRPGLKIYQDKELTKIIELTEISNLQNNKSIDPNKEDIEFIEISSFQKNNIKYIELQINLVKKDLSFIESDPLQAIEKGKRTKIRTIYFPAKDDKGRINYWYQPQSC